VAWPPSRCREASPEERAAAGKELLLAPSFVRNNEPQVNPNGKAATFSTNGMIDLNNEFFQVLGTNGRRCATCHVSDQGWTVSPGLSFCGL
jgi:hypothetical protein